ncbi:MAG TPA: zinc ribbon domain-containing protein [Candidatus Limnocylindrales bacterium]|nr:zinc ribbon domain-containing protein [Candidatus Limnocylindrales bacterium]
MMIIVCQRCGNYEPEDSQFCGKCRAFLEFEGTRVEGQWVDGKLARTSEIPVTADVAGQQPGEEQKVYRPRVEPVRRPAEGEIPCPKCGRGNDPARTYCRFDGQPLRPAAGTEQERIGWWKRLWRKLTRRRSYVAGERRRKVRQPRKVPVKWISLGIVAALLVVFNVQVRQFTAWAQAEIKDRVSKHQAVTPSKWAASSVQGTNGPERLSDRSLDKFWAPRVGANQGSWVEATFPQPVRLLDIVVTGGQSGEAVQFQKQGRPHEIQALMTSQSGATVTAKFNLEDKQGAQSFKVKGDRINKVRLTFVDAHGMQPGRYLAVAEMEFFYRQ